MPKLGMEPIRREALVRATIAELGAAGTLDVTVSQIARRAGVSSALAHHYFGGKDQIFLAAMRRILADFGADVRHELRASRPRLRAEAIVRACFSGSSFTAEAVGAWMCFYVLAQSNAEALRLWQIYHLRLRSNLIHALRPVCSAPEVAADTLGALIDGLYIRAALDPGLSPAQAEQQALSVLNNLCARPQA
ncbi:choline-binding transcriptional repressor BetI [Pseudodonghicola xiamenensis]|uniref:HTH-type transcriptional regulator BetI n=1 Tax=Pseudodonghicola xiamenensis TaxID=337702 RepID=A0A8J3H8L7_9RHOB|nr:transcriptional regulator BetI [Pseudodonghicola xiamenensis]GHG91111.1 HTH-type transcriptional regulator BetI [Pseudodonghicola xiamenensis]